GARGFGYDAVFVPDEGDGRTFAEMSDAEKNALSHRGRAFRNLLAALR
ncbi:MAG TPA: non-canonical purine NTP pyrophosphatase, partial [Ilumatobacter sp.]|nr:non-canonical purine NTP pyrophosphatase [Ilumatobacter sp.]